MDPSQPLPSVVPGGIPPVVLPPGPGMYPPGPAGIPSFGVPYSLPPGVAPVQSAGGAASEASGSGSGSSS